MRFIPCQRTLLRTMLGFAAIVAFALGALTLADRFRNEEAIREHIVQAFTEQRFGDDQGYEWAGRHTSSHFSECIGLSTAIAGAEGGSFWRTLNSPTLLWQAPTPICQSLAASLNSPRQGTWFAYSRYWHGYRVITEPVLSGFSYATLQIVCALLLLASGIVAGLALRALIGLPLVAITAVAILIGTDLRLVAHLPTHAISLSALLLGWAAILHRARRQADMMALIPWAFGVGAAYNFFDFLYNPDLLAYLAGWSFFLAAMAQKRLPTAEAFKRALFLQFIIVCGYMAMWAAKWLLVWGGGLVFGATQWFPAQDFGRWLGGGDHAYIPLAALTSILYESTALPYGRTMLPLYAASLGALLVLAFRRGQVASCIGLLGLCLFPVLMLEAKANHTLQHAAITFRFIPFALILSIIGMARLIYGVPSWRKPRAFGN